MKKRTQITMAMSVLLIVTLVCLFYANSPYRNLSYMNAIYSRVEHPDWSRRILMKKAVLPNMGSGDHSMLYLIDVRRVGVAIPEAIAAYDRRNEEVGITEFHLDPVTTARRKFGNRWDEMKIDVSNDPDTLVITLMYSSDTGRRWYLKAEQPVPPDVE